MRQLLPYSLVPVIGYRLFAPGHRYPEASLFEVFPGPADICGLDRMWLTVKGNRRLTGEMPEFFYKMCLIKIPAVVDDVKPIQRRVGTLQTKRVIEAEHLGIVFWRHADIVQKIPFQ